jgi:hypothetical protein
MVDEGEDLNPYEDEDNNANSMHEMTSFDNSGDNVFRTHLQKTIKEYEYLLKLNNFKSD